MWLDTPFLNHTLERQSSGLPGHQQGGRGLLQQWENSLHLRSGCSWPEKEILRWALMAEAVCDTVIPPSITLQWCFPKSVSPLTCILLGVQTVFYSSLYPSSLSSLSPDILINVCWVQECMNNSSFGIGVLAPWLPEDRWNCSNHFQYIPWFPQYLWNMAFGPS